MKLSGMAFINPNYDLVGFDERFEGIVYHEWELQFNKKFSRFLKKPHQNIHRLTQTGQSTKGQAAGYHDN